MQKKTTLGILGGLGPMATVYFYEMLTSRTSAESDQEHIDVVISSRATTPDRSAFIMGKSTENPLPFMIEEAKKLVEYGADILVMPCNTAHYFYDELVKTVCVPFINIVEETVKLCKAKGYKKLGILATEGTARSGAYSQVCEKFGVECAVPSDEKQKLLMEIIFEDIKKGKRADMDRFGLVCDELEKEGCDALVLGCTELSLIKKEENLGEKFVDSLEALCNETIARCGKKVRN